MEFTADLATKADGPPAIQLRGKSPCVSKLQLLITAEGVILSGTTDALGADDIKQLCVVLRTAAKILVGFRAGLPAPIVAGIGVRNKPPLTEGAAPT